jgi:hypothetical protein
MNVSQSGDRGQRDRRERFRDRYEAGVAFLVSTWTAAFVIRARLGQSGRLNEIGNEALLSLLFVVPIMLIGWGVLAVADQRYKLGIFPPRRRR